mmetsp:Transcript_34195/g.108962  ORF Transcript_34195/g.108962 Transcript_34195/m.108962 type:complete len:250 (-) Transcript_34195:963-1712(-)|eukprot:scaffold8630_cov115-Isochrysis_galbana.AAC.10
MRTAAVAAHGRRPGVPIPQRDGGRAAPGWAGRAGRLQGTARRTAPPRLAAARRAAPRAPWPRPRRARRPRTPHSPCPTRPHQATAPHWSGQPGLAAPWRRRASAATTATVSRRPTRTRPRVAGPAPRRARPMLRACPCRPPREGRAMRARACAGARARAERREPGDRWPACARPAASQAPGSPPRPPAARQPRRQARATSRQTAGGPTGAPRLCWTGRPRPWPRRAAARPGTSPSSRRPAAAVRRVGAA